MPLLSSENLLTDWNPYPAANRYLEENERVDSDSGRVYEHVSPGRGVVVNSAQTSPIHRQLDTTGALETHKNTDDADDVLVVTNALSYICTAIDAIEAKR